MSTLQPHAHNPYAQYAPPPVMHHYVPPASAAAAPPAASVSPAPAAASPTMRAAQSAPASAGTVAPNDTYTQSLATAAAQLQTSTAAQAQPVPLIAQGDWTKNLVHLAMTAELKKHALTLQLHTAHIISAQGTLDTKNKSLQDIKEQKNKLESERTRLLNCLREVNEDRDKADLTESTILKEVQELRAKIQTITDGEYTAAKREVDVLRAELGQPPAPSLQQTLEEKSAAYLKERLTNGASGNGDSAASTSSPLTAGAKRVTGESPVAAAESPAKRPRGRPKGSKNKNKLSAAEAATG